MKVLARVLAPLAAATAALALTATSATAAEAAILRDGPGGTEYSGKIRFTNLSPLSVSTVIIGITVNAQCSSAVLNGSLATDGTGTLDTVTVSGCSSNVGAATVTFENLPYEDATVDYAPVPGGRDGTLTFSDADLRIRAAISILGIPRTCYYGFGSNVSELVFDLYNPDNPNRPDPSVAEAQGEMNDASLDRLSGSNAICPATGTANGYGTVLGETTADSGVFDQTLYATAAE